MLYYSSHAELECCCHISQRRWKYIIIFLVSVKAKGYRMNHEFISWKGEKIIKESNRHVRCCLHYIGIIEDNLELVTFFLLFFILKSTTLIELRHFISRSNQYRWVSLRFTSLWTSRSNSSPNTSHLFVQTHIRAAQGWSRCRVADARNPPSPPSLVR